MSVMRDLFFGTTPGVRRVRRIATCLGLCSRLWGTFASPCSAETRRALLVGIDRYRASDDGQPPGLRGGKTAPVDRGWVDLDGAVNDVTAVREILVARYGFRPENVRVLTNDQASRAAILQSFRAQLIEAARSGDVCVFYYAGHGSQVKNLRCPEQDCRDETTVPADANRGAWDIRDKEWAGLFNDVLDRGALLTVFFDSCHSGSISRGLGSPGKCRFLAPDPRGAPADGPEVGDPRGAPTDRGALAFSATQEFQRADELVDGQGVPHGAFSLAVIKTLRSMPVDEPAGSVLRRVAALVHSSGATQEPALAGSRERVAQGLFGPSPRGGEGTRVALIGVDPEGRCALEGGLALGFCPGCELYKVDRSPGRGPNAHEIVRVRVDEVQGMNRCVGQVVQGSPADLAPGDLLELDRWAGCDEPFLRVWIPPATLLLGALERQAQEFAKLRGSQAIRWVEDPSAETPTHILMWESGKWQLVDQRGGRSEALGPTPSAKSIAERLRTAMGDTVRLFVYLPPPPELAAALGFGPRDMRFAVESTRERTQAQYMLVGRWRDGRLEYAWVRPNLAGSDSETSSSLPSRTDWHGLGGSIPTWTAVAARLQDLALRMGKVRMWQQLEPPPDAGGFPYRLALLNVATGRIEERSTLYEGERFKMTLVADARRLRSGVHARYVYVFAVDSRGTTMPIFPRSENEGNHLPYESEHGIDPDSAIVLEPSAVSITRPFGTDTYFLLATEEPIPDIRVLQQDAVRTRGNQTAETPLSRLLAGVRSGTRGIRMPTPVDWSLQRLSVRSVARAGR